MFRLEAKRRVLESIEMLNPSVKARIKERLLSIKNDPVSHKRFDFWIS
jgi:hypothetical protein